MKTFEDYKDLVYTSVVRSTQLSDGITPWFMAEHPQLPGCLSDGATEADALQNLEDARKEYITSLLEDNIEVPVPAMSARASRTETATVAKSSCYEAETSIRIVTPAAMVAD